MSISLVIGSERHQLVLVSSIFMTLMYASRPELNGALTQCDVIERSQLS